MRCALLSHIETAQQRFTSSWYRAPGPLRHRSRNSLCNTRVYVASCEPAAGPTKRQRVTSSLKSVANSRFARNRYVAAVQPCVKVDSIASCVSNSLAGGAMLHVVLVACSCIVAAASSSMTEAPVGGWKSPISSELIVSQSIRLGSPVVGPDGSLFWSEGRPTEGGRQAIVRRYATSPWSLVT